MGRALVLGGGGPVGIAWESGLIAGLAQAGLDLGQADLIMGTSAGSFVGARLALGAEAAKLADPILAEAAAPPKAPDARPAPERPAPNLGPLIKMMGEAQGGARNPQDVRAEIGAFALGADTADEAAYIQTFGRSFASLPDDAWPERDYACTAVDVETGAFQLWTRASGVGITRAVASSCAVPGVYPPVTLKGRRYMDGGMRSATNADLAVGHELVIVVQVRIAAMSGAAYAQRFQDEIDVLTGRGAQVVVMAPDEASQAAMGVNLMDFRKRADAARAGLAQGQADAADLMAMWG